MIVVVGLNPALDATYVVDDVTIGTEHRVVTEVTKVGGKGVNVARVLRQLGHDPLIVGVVAGDTGRIIRDDLKRSGIESVLLDVDGESRRTVTVVSRDATATTFNEPGPTMRPTDWSKMLELTTAVFEDANPLDVVVLSGSLPPGLPPDAYRLLAEIANQHSIGVILDASGEALLSGIASRPLLVKPNARELSGATGKKDPHAGAETLRDLGALNVVVTLGKDGMIACTPGGCWRAVLDVELTGNPTGAGDATTALFAARLCDDPGSFAIASSVRALDPSQWPDLLAHAVAISAASLGNISAGHVDITTYERWVSSVEVTAL